MKQNKKRINVIDVCVCLCFWKERAGKENNNKSIKGQQEGKSEAMNVVVVVVKGQCEGGSDSKVMNIVGGGDDLVIKVHYLHHDEAVEYSHLLD